MKIDAHKRKKSELEHGKILSLKNNVYWERTTAAGIRRNARRTDLIIARANMVPGKRVLEIGCGNGIFTEKFSGTGAMITALDLSPHLLALAQKQITAPNVSFIAGDAEKLDFPDESFDAVVGVSILHHLDHKTALKEMRRVLRPGGKIVFSEPNMLNPQIMLQKNIPFLKKMAGDSEYETAYFRWPMQKSLAQIGFSNIIITPFDWVHPLVPNFLIKLAEKIGAFLEKTPVIKEFAGSLFIYAERA